MHGWKFTALLGRVTGRTPAQETAIHDESRRRPVFLAANFSLGIAVLNHLVRQAVQALGPQFETEVFEIHHRRKADAPRWHRPRVGSLGRGGIRLPMARIPTCSGWKRRTRRKRKSALPRFEAGRSGEHTVYLLGDSERLELTHRATNRDVFALGALRAAEWVAHRAPGLYDMKSMLNF